VAKLVFAAIAILDVRYFLSSPAYRLVLIGALMSAFSYFVYAVITLAAAWLLSRWVFAMGPLRSLSTCRFRLKRSNHV